MNTYTVETGIPIPERSKRTGLMDVLKKLEVGQSVLLPQKRQGSAASNSRLILGKKFVTRRVGDGMCRVWRVE